MASNGKTPPGASGTRTRFAGLLSDVSIGDLFQTLEMSGKSSEIDFDTELGAGTVWFRDREVIDAVSGECEGADAVYRIAMAEEGSFVARFKDIERPARIHLAPQRVLMESARREDEWKKAAAGRARPGTCYAAIQREVGLRTGDLTHAEFELLAKLDGSRLLVDVIIPGDEAAPEEFKRLATLLDQGLLEEVAPPKALLSSLIRGAVSETPENFMVAAYAAYAAFGGGARKGLRYAAALILVGTLLASLVLGWRVLVGGQLLGWGLLLIGHGISSLPQLPLWKPAHLFVEPVLVIADMLGGAGVELGFVHRGRELARLTADL